MTMTHEDVVPGVRLRGYQRGDEERILALWQLCLPTDPIAREVFIARILLDVNFEPDGFIVAEAGANVVGFLYAAVRATPMYHDDFEPEDGWTTVFFVHPDWRRRGIGRALVRAAEVFVQARGRTALAISPYAPHYVWPGPDVERHAAATAFLSAAGYTVIEEPVAMDIGLVGFSVPEDVRRLRDQRERDGYVIGALERADIVGVLDFAFQQFGADWARAIRDALARGVGLQHVLTARQGDSVVGFCLWGGYDHVAERFGPFGVHPDLRGRGLGKLLLYDCLTRMQASGLHTAYFIWTGEDDPAGHLYRQVGFRVTRRFQVFRRTL